jgi:hypothetical protein
MNDVVRFGESLYVMVKRRVHEFRQKHQLDLGIETSVVDVSERGVLFKAIIKNSAGDILSTGHRYVLHGDFDAFATAETQAVGRALSFLGFGSEDLLPEVIKELSDLADSPVSVKTDGKSSEGNELAERLARSKTIPFTAQTTTR